MKRDDVKEAPQVFQVGNVVELVEKFYHRTKGMSGPITELDPHHKNGPIAYVQFDCDTYPAGTLLKRLRLVSPAESAEPAQNTFSHIFDLIGKPLPTLCVEDGKIYESRDKAEEARLAMISPPPNPYDNVHYRRICIETKLFFHGPEIEHTSDVEDE